MRTLRRYTPGVFVTVLLGLLAWLVQHGEERLWGHAIIEALVVALLLGVLVRTVWTPGEAWRPGIDYTAKQVLEAAVFLLGASVNLDLLGRAGASLAVGIALVVVVGLTAGAAVGRVFGLPPKLALLVACGNAICGNSAIAALAPVIRADKQDVAASIAFTAILGVVMVLSLPWLMHLLHYSFYQYGVLAGMTVYAVPQVLAASFPVSALSGEVGTLVKLTRVLMLGPVVLFFAVRHRDPGAERRFSLGRFVPWFIVGFLALAAARSLGLLPAAVAGPLREVSRWMTVAALAALGLGVDLKAVRSVGRPVVLAVSGSLVMLITLSVTLIYALGLP